MFTIQRILKIQAFFYHNPRHEEISRSVKYYGEGDPTMLNHLLTLHSNNVSEIINHNGGLGEELNRFGIRELKRYFEAYPSSWYDLKRKIHKHKTENGREVKKEKEEDILHIFLRRGRDDTLIDADQIERIWRQEVLQNRKLIQEISGEPSLLDSSHGQILRLNLSQANRVQFIRKMIELGLHTNTAIKSNDTIDAVLGRIVPKLLEFLKSIFEIDFSQQGFPKKINLEDISRWLAKKIWTQDERGVQSKNAWMFVKAIRAWGGYEEIVMQHTQVSQSITKLSDKLNNHGILFAQKGVRDDYSYNDKVKVAYGDALINKPDGTTVRFTLEYRLKSLRSIMLKLWSEEDYNNIDALRDMVGVAIIWGDGVTEDDKLSITAQCTDLFAHKGYMAKNKGLFFDTEKYSGTKAFKDVLQKSEKKPLGTIAQKKREKTSTKFKNASFSGFTKIDNIPIGLEIMFYDQASYNFWKEDHYTYDPLKVVSAWSRGSWFLTPKQLLNTIRVNIHQTVRETKLKKLPQEILWDYVNHGSIFLYVGSSGEIYAVPKQFEKEFLGKFDRVQKLEKNSAGVREFIRNLSEESNGETSSPPPSQDPQYLQAAE